MIKLKHLRHPFQTLQTAKELIAHTWKMKTATRQDARRYRNDVRYDPQNVTAGFASRLEENADDTAILERICAAYNKAIEQLSTSKEAYLETKWWQSVREARLAPVQQALASRDTKTLRAMYRNFFRDPCGSGLVQASSCVAKAYSGGAVDESCLRFLMGDALYRIDYWKAQTASRFALRDLAGPGTGNPFGVMIDGTLVRTGTEYHHYCAHRIIGLLQPAGPASVAEIGGGFGSMAYYLLRDRQDIRYFDFDVPESIALTSYYLLKSLPHLKFLLYGEENLSEQACSKFDVVLMPPSELAALPESYIDLTFSSHTLGCLSDQALLEYIHQIARTTRTHFLHVCLEKQNASLQSQINAKFRSLAPPEQRRLEWNTHGYANVEEAECLYSLGGSTPAPRERFQDRQNAMWGRGEH
jgi:putative sugar O-methyltransferase